MIRVGPKIRNYDRHIVCGPVFIGIVAFLRGSTNTDTEYIVQNEGERCL